MTTSKTAWGPFKATVTDVHDGDTITALLDLGFGIELSMHLRIFGINAPELSTPAGKDALGYALTLVKPGDAITVVSEGWDKFGGRADATVTLADGSDFAVRMIAAGKASAWNGQGAKPVPAA